MNTKKILCIAMIILLSVGIVSAGSLWDRKDIITIKPKPIIKPLPTGDISVSGSSGTPTILRPPESLFIMVDVKNTFNRIINTKVEVQIFASNGQPIPLYQSKLIQIGANGVSNQILEFKTENIPEGTYQVRISSPVLNGETSTSNNVYNFNIVAPHVPKPDFSLNKFKVSTTYDIGRTYIVYGENFLTYFEVQNKGTDTSTGTIVVKTEGVILYKETVTLTPSQIYKKYVTLRSDIFPHRKGDAFGNCYYTIIGDVSTSNDVNLQNNLGNAALTVNCNW